MKKFIRLTSLYIILLTALIFFLLVMSSEFVRNRDFRIYETESNLLVMKDNESFDLLFMGISHARNFSRHGNHLQIEKTLGKKITNIAQGGGRCGLNEQLFYLDYFYRNENRAKKIVFVLSPPLLFSETLPVASNTFDYEPFEWSFFVNYLLFDSENKNERLLSYIQSKFSMDWYSHNPSPLKAMTEKLERIDSNAVLEGQALIFRDSIQFDRFNKNVVLIEDLIRKAKSNQSEVVLIIPPALFGKWRGHIFVERLAEGIKRKYGVEYYDFSESILEPSYYYDHHHLNTKGVFYFTETFLKPIFANKY